VVVIAVGAMGLWVMCCGGRFGTLAGGLSTCCGLFPPGVHGEIWVVIIEMGGGAGSARWRSCAIEVIAFGVSLPNWRNGTWCKVGLLDRSCSITSPTDCRRYPPLSFSWKRVVWRERLCIRPSRTLTGDPGGDGLHL
jgi:hypothetical protein